MTDRRCKACTKVLVSTNKRALYCDSTCRANATKRRAKGVPEAPIQLAPPVSPVSIGPVQAATLAELTAAGRESTALGAACLALAERIDMRLDTGSALASAVGRLGETLALATKGAKVADTALDQLRARRDAKRGA